MTDDKPNLSEFDPNNHNDGDSGLTDLSALHETAWSNIQGAYVRVKHDVTDHTLTLEERRANTTTKIREGVIAGRGEGVGVYYDGDVGEVLTHSIGPAVYIRTPEDSVLEVRTGKAGNELLEFVPGGEHDYE